MSKPFANKEPVARYVDLELTCAQASAGSLIALDRTGRAA